MHTALGNLSTAPTSVVYRQTMSDPFLLDLLQSRANALKAKQRAAACLLHPDVHHPCQGDCPWRANSEIGHNLAIIGLQQLRGVHQLSVNIVAVFKP